MTNITLFLLVLRARLGIVLLTFAVVVATALAYTLLAAPKYTASTSVVIDYRANDPLSQQPVAPAQLSPAYMATQVDIIGSRKVALQVVDNLKLADNASVRKNFEEATGGQGSLREWLADVLLRDLVVKPGRESRVVSISFSATDPRFAAALADAFAQAYIETNLDLSIEPARRNAAWFDEQLKSLRVRMEQAQHALTLYQQQRGITAIDERYDTETKRLADLATQLVTAQAEVYDVKARQLGENHPQYQRASARENLARAAHEQQKSNVLQFKKQRDEMAFLARETETAQRIYDAALQRYNQTILESQVTQTNIAVLSRAAVPLKPAGPNIVRNLVLASLFASMLGVGLAFFVEMAFRRVRTKGDSFALNLPLLGVTARGAV